MRKLNINNYVLVKLNDKGKRIMFMQKHLFHAASTEPVENGLYKFQLWEFMQLFGEHLYMGCEPISEKNELFFYERELVKCE